MTQNPQLPPPPRFSNLDLDRIIDREGGVFHLLGNYPEWVPKLFQGITTSFQRHVEHAQQKLYVDRPREISFAVLSNRKLNAICYASPADEGVPFDFIGINVGSILTLTDIFTRLLSHPHAFPLVGDAKAEDANRALIPFITPHLMESPRFKDEKSVAPLDEARNIYSGLLLQTSLDFLFFHELSHLRNGHLEWRRYVENAQTMEEAVSASDGKKDRMHLQALEMDADSGAVLLTLNAVFDLKDRFASLKKDLPASYQAAFRAAYGSAAEATKTVVLSMYMISRLFDLPAWDPIHQHLLSHPQAPLRQLMNCGVLQRIFETRPQYNYSPTDFLQDSAAAIFDLERGLGLIQEMEPDARGFMSVCGSELAREHMEELEAAWKKIRPDLEPFKRGGKLAD